MIMCTWIFPYACLLAPLTTVVGISMGQVAEKSKWVFGFFFFFYKFVSVYGRAGAAEMLILLLSICLHVSLILSDFNLGVSLQREKWRIFEAIKVL